MSGPVIVSMAEGVIGGVEVNRLHINGILGEAHIYPLMIDDEVFFGIYFGGKLTVKEVIIKPLIDADMYKPVSAETVVPDSTQET